MSGSVGRCERLEGSKEEGRVLSRTPLDSRCRTMPSACCSPAGSSPTAT